MTFYKKTFTITVYSASESNSDEEIEFIIDMQNRVDTLAAYNMSNSVEVSVAEYEPEGTGQ